MRHEGFVGRFWAPTASALAGTETAQPVFRFPTVHLAPVGFCEPIFMPSLVKDWFLLRALLVTLPGLALSRGRRQLLREMRQFDQNLMETMRRPLPLAMDKLTPSENADLPEQGDQHLIRRLGDVAILANGESGLGLCLRRSMLRYHFLRRTGLPVTINFGARMIGGKPDRPMAGHAWLTLDQAPYHEAGENWRGFTVMYSFPEDQA
jgi:hypothetical protein